MKADAPLSFLERHPAIANMLRLLFCCATVFILLPEGSVRALPLYLIAIPIFTLAALVALVVAPAERHGWVFRVGAGAASLIAFWSLFQSFGFQGNVLANPVWRATAEVLGPGPGSISVVPADTIAAIVPVLLPFAIFLTAVLLFSSDRAATMLLRFLAVSGGLVAIYGIVQLELFPQYLMFRKKEYYLQDLTAVLVNRNSIATYLGATLLLNAGLLYDSLLPLAPRNGWGGAAVYARRHFRVTGYSLLHGALFVIVLVALLLTKSRAGTASTFLALLGLVVFFVFDGYARIEQRSRRLGPRGPKMAVLGTALAASVSLAFVFVFLGGRVLLRADAQGLEDGRFCAYPTIIRLLQDNWLLGTGLGSFREVFPRYQNPACGDALWDRAHSLYLEGWIDLGAIFVFLLLVVVLGLSLAFLTGLRKRKSMRWASATGWAVLMLFMLHSTVDFSIQIPGVAVFFAAIMAAASIISLNRSWPSGAGGDRSKQAPRVTPTRLTSATSRM